MTREIPIRRARVNPENGWVVPNCPATEKPKFTHANDGCIKCKHNKGASETILTCDYPDKNESVHESLRRAREILANLESTEK
jgi:hypothetical protein